MVMRLTRHTGKHRSEVIPVIVLASVAICGSAAASGGASAPALKLDAGRIAAFGGDRTPPQHWLTEYELHLSSRGLHDAIHGSAQLWRMSVACPSWQSWAGSVRDGALDRLDPRNTLERILGLLGDDRYPVAEARKLWDTAAAGATCTRPAFDAALATMRKGWEAEEWIKEAMSRKTDGVRRPATADQARAMILEAIKNDFQTISEGPDYFLRIRYRQAAFTDGGCILNLPRGELSLADGMYKSAGGLSRLEQTGYAQNMSFKMVQAVIFRGEDVVELSHTGFPPPQRYGFVISDQVLAAEVALASDGLRRHCAK